MTVPAEPATGAAPATDQARPDQVGPWWRHAVVYQIYPRSFADSNRGERVTARAVSGGHGAHRGSTSSAKVRMNRPCSCPTWWR